MEGLQIQWSFLDVGSYTRREGTPATITIADFASIVDTYRDITARFPVAVPAWAKLSPMDQATLESMGWQRSNALVVSHCANTLHDPAGVAPVSADLSDAIEFTGPLRMLLAGSPQLPSTADPLGWSAVSASAVLHAVKTEVSVMGEQRFDARLRELLSVVQDGAPTAQRSMLDAMQSGGVLRQLAAWLHTSFSPGTRIAAPEAYPVPAERSDALRKRLRPLQLDGNSFQPPPLRHVSRLPDMLTASPLTAGGNVQLAMDLSHLGSEGSSSEQEASAAAAQPLNTAEGRQAAAIAAAALPSAQPPPQFQPQLSTAFSSPNPGYPPPIAPCGGPPIMQQPHHSCGASGTHWDSTSSTHTAPL